MKINKDKVHGILSGLAAGDRIGDPIRMALQLAKSLISKKEFDIVYIGNSYLKWWNEGGFDTGPVAGDVFEMVNSGKSYREAATIVHKETGGMTAGCNPAHRSAPLTMAAFFPSDHLAGLAMLKDLLINIRWQVMFLPQR